MHIILHYTLKTETVENVQPLSKVQYSKTTVCFDVQLICTALYNIVLFFLLPLKAEDNIIDREIN